MLLDQLTSAQLSEWIAYNDLDPIGEWREDFRFAKIEARLVNIVREIYHEKGKEPEMVAPIDMMPEWDENKMNKKKKITQRQTMDQQRELLMALSDTQNRMMDKERKERPLPQVKVVPPSYRKEQL